MNQQTVVIIKPDAVKRGLVGTIQNRYLDAGLHVIYRDRRRLEEWQSQDLYAEHMNKPFFDGLVLSMTGQVCVVLILCGENAIQVVRDLNGATKWEDAKPGTIRHDFRSAGGPYNMVHASDSHKASAREAMILLAD